MHFINTLNKISAFVAVATALQIQSNNPAFQNAGRQGCISAASNDVGASVVINNCTTETTSEHNENWDFTPFSSGVNSTPRSLKIFGDKCLDVTNGINTDGTKLQIWTCVDGNTNQQWISVTDFTFQWAGTNKCIDLTDGNINPGTRLQLWTCDSSNSNQQWSALDLVTTEPPPPPSPPVLLLANGGPPHIAGLCLAASSDTDGASVGLAVWDDPTRTFPDGNITWVLPVPGATGQIKTFDGTKCLDVRDGDSTNGNSLQIWSCIEGNDNQLWNMDLDGSFGKLISWAGRNKCVNVRNGYFVPGNEVCF
ncbi:hypothetical protein L218DRAFT_936088 [Marasmius fiardii PR-910]|nr:hypothetical protein L218DRAFT_936088 [Marasmius fiardii PR-910]